MAANQHRDVLDAENSGPPFDFNQFMTTVVLPLYGKCGHRMPNDFSKAIEVGLLGPRLLTKNSTSTSAGETSAEKESTSFSACSVPEIGPLRDLPLGRGSGALSRKWLSGRYALNIRSNPDGWSSPARRNDCGVDKDGNVLPGDDWLVGDGAF